MKNNRFLLMVLMTAVSFGGWSENKALLSDGKKVVYTFLINEVPDGSNLPLIGLINTAHGDQQSLHLGLINTNGRNLSGLQTGLINTTGNNLKGFQIGFINTIGRNLSGIQTGFINSIGDNAHFLQLGFINSVGKGMLGFQLGFINSIEKNLIGCQVGFLNSSRTVAGLGLGFINASRTVTGSQIGFLNASRSMAGLQVGFINSVRTLSGVQFGFINSVRSVSDGVPVGFLSFVRNGGLKALELSLTEMYPVNLALKIGIREFYSFPMISWNPNRTNDVAFGFGFGSNITINDEYFFNPEFSSHFLLSENFDRFQSMSASFGYRLTENVDLLLGPTLTWKQSASIEPIFHLDEREINANNKLIVGARAALRYNF
jgi:hypothetical protein